MRERSNSTAAVLGRITLKVVCSLIALFVAYLVIANVALGAVLRDMAAQAGMRLERDSAYTLFPGRVRIDGLRLSGAGGDAWKVSFDRAVVQVNVWKLLRGSAWIDSMDGGVRSIVVGPWRLTGAMHAEALELRSEGGVPALRSASLALSGGELRLDDRPIAQRVDGTVTAGPAVPDGAAIHAALTAAPLPAPEAEGASPTPGPTLVSIDVDGRLAEGDPVFQGTVRARGDDAAALLDLAGVTGSARWALSGVEGWPFVASAALATGPSVTAVDDVRFEGARLDLRGALRWAGRGREGAFLVRRGTFVSGISVDGERVSAVFAPDEAWLTGRLGAMKRR